MAWPDFAYDLYEDFEDALSASWTETDTDSNIDPASTTAKKNGSYGLLINWRGATAGGNTAYLGYAAAAEKTAFSCGFWVYLPTLSANTSQVFWSWSTTATNMNEYNLKMYYTRNSASSYDIKMRRSDGTYSDVIAIPTTNAWYWITINGAKNASSTLRIYNDSHEQVGSDVTFTAGNNAGDCFVFGLDISRDYDVAFWFDDFVVDWTDSTFPLLGWEAAAGTSISRLIFNLTERRRRM